jgi:hypothetical protein
MKKPGGASSLERKSSKSSTKQINRKQKITHYFIEEPKNIPSPSNHTTAPSENIPKYPTGERPNLRSTKTSHTMTNKWKAKITELANEETEITDTLIIGNNTQQQNKQHNTHSQSSSIITVDGSENDSLCYSTTSSSNTELRPSITIRKSHDILESAYHSAGDRQATFESKN